MRTTMRQPTARTAGDTTRSRILTALSVAESLGLPVLVALVGAETGDPWRMHSARGGQASRVQTVKSTLAGLVREGLVVRDGERWRLA